MRILIAPQEFKGTLTAHEAALAIEAGIHRFDPGWSCERMPMADGGPGTLDALLHAKGGERRSARAQDPLQREVEAEWAILSSGVAVVECAAASGLWRLSPDERDPRLASTYGTGQLIAAALDAGCRELIVGLGGSATNDGGAGMAQALGYRLLDADGRDLPRGGAALARLDRIDATTAH
ncbi:MAG: glycerate kinase, partial [Dehalococcoidia bacterium]